MSFSYDISLYHITTTPPAFDGARLSLKSLQLFRPRSKQAPLLLEEGNLFPLLGQVSLAKHGSNSPPFQGGEDASEAQQTGWFIGNSKVQNASFYTQNI